MIRQLDFAPSKELINLTKGIWSFPNSIRLASDIFRVGLPLIKKEFDIFFYILNELPLVYSLSNFENNSYFLLTYKRMSRINGFDKMQASMIYPGTNDSFGVEIVRARKKDKSSLENYFKKSPIAGGIFLYGKNPEEIIYDKIKNFI